MKRIVSVLLLISLLLTLTACAGKGKGTLQEDEDKAKLIGILNDIADNYHPGTAGSSLTSIRIAADLVSWAASSNMSKKEAAGVVGEWLKEQSPEIKEAFKEKASQIAESYGKIIKNEAEGLLESAGVEKDFSNLGSRMKEIAQAVIDAANK